MRMVCAPTIRNGKLGIVGYVETGSGNREVLRDKTGRILGRFETDTKVTRNATGTITGRGSNQLLRLLKSKPQPVFVAGGVLLIGFWSCRSRSRVIIPVPIG